MELGSPPARAAPLPLAQAVGVLVTTADVDWQGVEAAVPVDYWLSLPRTARQLPAAPAGEKLPGPLLVDHTDGMCDLTIRPQKLAEMMKDTLDCAVGCGDLLVIAPVVHQAHTRFGGHTDVQIELSALRAYAAKLRLAQQAGVVSTPKPAANTSPRGRQKTLELELGLDPEPEPEPAAPEPEPVRVAVIGAGYVGARVAAELLIEGLDVWVYDRAGTTFVMQAVSSVLTEDGQRSVRDFALFYVNRLPF